MLMFFFTSVGVFLSLVLNNMIMMECWAICFIFLLVYWASLTNGFLVLTEFGNFLVIISTYFVHGFWSWDIGTYIVGSLSCLTTNWYFFYSLFKIGILFLIDLMIMFSSYICICSVWSVFSPIRYICHLILFLYL